MARVCVLVLPSRARRRKLCLPIISGFRKRDVLKRMMRPCVGRVARRLMNSKSHIFSTAVLTLLSRQMRFNVILNVDPVMPRETAGGNHFLSRRGQLEKKALR